MFRKFIQLKHQYNFETKFTVKFLNSNLNILNYLKNKSFLNSKIY